MNKLIPGQRVRLLVQATYDEHGFAMPLGATGSVVSYWHDEQFPDASQVDVLFDPEFVPVGTTMRQWWCEREELEVLS